MLSVVAGTQSASASVQTEAKRGVSSCNFIADWTIVMRKTSISIVGLALATSELATTDLPER